MQNANTLLRIIAERGRNGQPLERIYRQLFNRDLYLMAYGRLYRNHGSMTPGSTAETVDGMSLAKIDTIITALRQERYRWTPVRRTIIPKPGSTKGRALGVPTWSDKLLQEVIRLILAAYFEPQFSETSHGFRPKRGCHTALRTIANVWTGTTWFIEGDIAQCFDRLDHQILIARLANHIHDGRFLRLITRLFQAGYLEQWRYGQTLSGVPQGSIIGPLLANIYLNQLDQFITTTLIPSYTRGNRRRPNPTYATLNAKIHRWRKAGRQTTQAYRQLIHQRRRLPSVDVTDPAYRRLWYVRYADDFLLGFSGPRSEAEAIKTQLDSYLRTTLHLELSQAKTLITHGRTEVARFLGYEVVVNHCDTKLDHLGRRSINGNVRFKVPATVIRSKIQQYCRKGKPIHRAERTVNTDFSIITQYQQEYRGVVEYYRLADNLASRLSQLKWVMECSLTKTLAAKFRTSVAKVYRRHHTTVHDAGRTYRVLRRVIERPGKRPLIAQWGGISLHWTLDAPVKDQPTGYINGRRTELIQRVLAETCELCGHRGNCEVHHIRALRDLNRPGQRSRPRWMQEMAARRRKTLVVCPTCHRDIHSGRIDGSPRSPNVKHWRAG